MRPRLGSMFSGYAGLDLAIHEVLDAETMFVADVCKVNKDGTAGHHEPHRSPCSILAHHLPDVPNLGDVSGIDWTPWRGLVDILCAGFPCQDVSVAGNRAGLRDGTRTGLWSQVVRAITELQPRMVVLENVPGIFTAPAAGDVEPCPWCLGDGSGEHLRALDAVLADLASLGFDAEWCVVPASGVGAAHKRERWFCIAWPIGCPPLFSTPTCSDVHGADHGHMRSDLRTDVAALVADARGGQLARAAVERDGLPVAPERGDEPLTLLPTPAVNDMGAAYTPETWDAWTAEMKAKHANGNGHGKSLNVEAQRVAERVWVDAEDPDAPPGDGYWTTRLLPTPSVADSTGGHERRGGKRGEEQQLKGVARAAAEGALLPTPTTEPLTGNGHARHLGNEVKPARWGEYEPAIRRQEAVMGRLAPEPTKPGAKGNPKLSDEFDEWLMGLPAGWITDVPGVTWNEALKACGNGVVPQQAAAAIRFLLARAAA